MTASPPLKWSAQLTVTPPAQTPKLPGDKIILPPAALEELLSAATVIVPVETAPPHNFTSSFDPFNPYTFEAERLARARLQFGERRQELPHPLTFRLVNAANGRVVYAGVREFSAAEGQVGLSGFLGQALGVGDELAWKGDARPSEPMLTVDAQQLPTTVTVHAQQLPKGTYVRFRPLEAGYDPEDWKSLLERHMRDTFTTLTKGEILSIPSGKEEYRFLVDKIAPDGDGICVVDTDLEVDIEALNEEQARETLKRRLEKSQKKTGDRSGSSAGGDLVFGKEENGQVLPGQYVDYTLKGWDQTKGIEIEMGSSGGESVVDLFVTPLSSRQRMRPREDEHVFADTSERPMKRVRIPNSNSEFEGAEALYISVYASPPITENAGTKPMTPDRPIQYSLRISQSWSEDATFPNGTHVDDNTPPNPNETRCKNCHQWVPEATLILHENFCYRNNILCPQCQNVFQKSSIEWQNHWHCPHDPSHGLTAASRHKHDRFHHTPHPCPLCPFTAPSLAALAHHRTTICPGKPILCQFCHLVLPQQSPDDPSFSDPTVLLSGLTPHELSDGARTTDCHLCSQIVRLRDMATHMKHHDYVRRSRGPPRVCRNANCGQVLDRVGGHGVIQRVGGGGGDDVGLCDRCFGPLYNSSFDPDGRGLRRRVERRYLTQLLTGCGREWCRNGYCRTGRKGMGMGMGMGGEGGDGDGDGRMTAKDAMRLIAPLLGELVLRSGGEGGGEGEGGGMFFCTDEESQIRRGVADGMAMAVAVDGKGVNTEDSWAKRELGDGDARRGGNGDGDGYDVSWCMAALQAEGGDVERARAWLVHWAPTRGEERERR